MTNRSEHTPSDREDTKERASIQYRAAQAMAAIALTVAAAVALPTTEEAPDNALAPAETSVPTTTASTVPILVRTTSPTTEKRVSDFEHRTGLSLTGIAPGWTVTESELPQRLCASTHVPAKEIQINGCTDKADRVFAHEVGHVLDIETMSDEDRIAWLVLRNMEVTHDAWWPSHDNAEDFDIGSGDFAENFGCYADFLAGEPLPILTSSHVDPLCEQQEVDFIAGIVAKAING